MPEFINAGNLNCAYFILFLVGVGYAIFILVTGGLSNIDVPDVNVDIPQIDLPGDVDIPGANVHIGGPDVPAAGLDAPDVSVSPLSPITIASFITAFGGIGVLTTQFFGVDPRWSLLWATLGGLAGSAGMFVFYSQVLIRAQGSSEIRRSEIVGLPAEVTVPIREGSVGQVAYLTRSGRMISTARAANGTAIARGELVKIVRVAGPVVLVQVAGPDMDVE